jgi:hypothetical protein
VVPFDNSGGIKVFCPVYVPSSPVVYRPTVLYQKSSGPTTGANMKEFIGIESSSGRIVHVTAKDIETAYHVIGRILYEMNEPIDTGNIDVDLYELTPSAGENARYVTP